MIHWVKTVEPMQQWWASAFSFCAKSNMFKSMNRDINIHYRRYQRTNQLITITPSAACHGACPKTTWSPSPRNPMQPIGWTGRFTKQQSDWSAGVDDAQQISSQSELIN